MSLAISAFLVGFVPSFVLCTLGRRARNARKALRAPEASEPMNRAEETSGRVIASESYSRELADSGA